MFCSALLIHATQVSRALLRSALIRRLAVVCNGAQMLSSMVGDLDLMPDVVVRERTQEGDQHPESDEDVDDREDLRVIAGRGEIPVAHGGQGHDREVEGLDE